MKRALVALALLAAPALADTPPLRGWSREGQEPLGEGESYQDETLPNGMRVRVRCGPNNRRRIVAVAPEALRLSGEGRFPDEKRWRDLASTGQVEGMAALLDKVLTASDSGRILLRPPWESPVWVSARTLARVRLLALPAEGKQAYRHLRDEDATAHFEQASRAGDAYELESLLDRYPAATAASKAALQAGDLFLEQGEVLAARLAWERARHDYADELDLAAVCSRIEHAALLDAARQERIHVRDDPVRSAHVALGVLPPGRLRPLWRRKIDAPIHAPSRLPGVLAVAHEDAVYIHDGRGVTAVELETGRLVWRTPLERVENPDEEQPATVSVGESAVVCVRGRRRAYLLERGTGRVAQEVDVARDLGGGANDRIDAAATERDRLYILATLSNDRVVLAFDRNGARLFRSELWPGGTPRAAFVVGHEGIFVLADGGCASLDRSGDVRWARPAEPLHLDPGRAVERALVRAGSDLILLEREGTTVLDAASGERRGLPLLPSDLLVVGAGDEGPVFLNPKPPRGDPQLLAIDGRHVLVVTRLDEASLPAWQGALEDGVLWLPCDRDLVALELASGRELGRTRFPSGPGRLSAAGSVVVSSRDEEVVAFASRAAPPLLAPLPDDARALVEKLSSADPRERRGARDRLRALGSAAEPALHAALEGSSAEARDVAAELLPATGLRAKWAKALDELGIDASVEQLMASSATIRRRALLRAHGGDTDPRRPSAALANALRGVLATDDDADVRFEALSWLVARDEEARASVARVLLDDSDKGGRVAAVEALVDSGAARADAPAHDLLVSVLSGDDELRKTAYVALLRHGGPREVEIVKGRNYPWKDKDGKDHEADPIADACLREAKAHPTLNGEETFRRRVERDEERRALLERVKLGE